MLVNGYLIFRLQASALMRLSGIYWQEHYLSCCVFLGFKIASVFYFRCGQNEGKKRKEKEERKGKKDSEISCPRRPVRNLYLFANYTALEIFPLLIA